MATISLKKSWIKMIILTFSDINNRKKIWKQQKCFIRDLTLICFFDTIFFMFFFWVQKFTNNDNKIRMFKFLSPISEVDVCGNSVEKFWWKCSNCKDKRSQKK